MPTTTHFWVEAVAILIGLVAIPLYMGIIHVSPPGAAAYAVVGGLAMAAGERLQFGTRRSKPALEDVLLWSAFIAAVGGAAYLVALVLV